MILDGRQVHRVRLLGRHVRVTVGLLANVGVHAVRVELAHRLHAHVKAGLLGTGHVKGHVAVALVTLYAGAVVLLFADVADQLPTGGRYGADVVDRLQEHGVREAHLRYPQGADHMTPLAVVGLLERAALVRAEDAVHTPGRTLQASSAKPLALRNVWYACGKRFV